MDAETRKKKIYRVTIVGSLANALLVALKFIAGIMGHSGAMIADAIHSVSDFVTDIIVLVFVKLSAKPKDKDHSYGHGKYETLATAIIGFALILAGAGIFWDSVVMISDMLKGHEIAAPDKIAFYAAIVSIVIKEILFQYTQRTGKAVGSEMVVANAWHHRSDALSSVGTAIGIGCAAFLGDKWVILDPIAALVVSLFIIKVALQLIAPSMNDLLEKSLPEETQQEIITLISEVPGISDPHNLHTRRIGNSFAIEIHTRVDPLMTVQEAHSISSQIENILKRKYGSETHVSVHMEPLKRSSDLDCQCFTHQIFGK